MMDSDPPTSSPEDDTANDLFPGEVPSPNEATASSIDRPLTPNNHLNAAAPGELSPPRSQRHGHDDPEVLYGDDASGATGNEAQVKQPDFMGGGEQERDLGKDEPGSEWKSKRAQEDYQRAMESVVDRDFNLRRFGDVLAVQPEEQRPK
jgi:hypothetical protein